jgi:hypothetical protein
MRIIVEGPDGAGKTTLVNALRQRLSCLRYHHEGPPPKEGSILRHYGSLIATKDDTIFDRAHFGELVYGPLLRGQSGLESRDMVMMRRLTRGLGVISILCLPPWEVCRTNTETRSEYLSAQQRDSAYWRWTRLVGEFTHVYDYTIADGLLPPLECLPSLNTGFIGSPEAKYVFVGERSNDPSPLTFFGYENSSGYLHEAITRAGFAEKDICFTNALLPDGSPNPNLTNPGFGYDAYVYIALGTVAAKACSKKRLAAYHVPHPQYWKRFHHHDMTAYVDMLKGAQEEMAA